MDADGSSTERVEKHQNFVYRIVHGFSGRSESLMSISTVAQGQRCIIRFPSTLGHYWTGSGTIGPARALLVREELGFLGEDHRSGFDMDLAI